jgi:integrase
MIEETTLNALRSLVEGLTFHDFRHEAITRLARKLDVLDLARMVGHRDLRQLAIYYNATAEEMAGRL